MTIYSSMIPDSNILTSLKGMRSTLIVGCASCANFSIAYDKNLPAYKVITDEKTGNKSLTPNAVHAEAERIQELLKMNGNNAEIELNDAWCMTTKDNELRALMGNQGWTDPGFKNRVNSHDSVLVLACHDGVRGVKGRLGDAVKVFPGMIVMGSQLVTLHMDSKGDNVVLDKEKSSVIRNM